jgi:small GTP-binding protein
MVIMGPSCVGKTSIITQLMHNQFEIKHRPTLQAMYRRQFQVGATKITLNIEDTGASFAEEFPAMAEVSLQHADGAVLVFSVADTESFEQVSKLKDFILSKRPTMPIVIVGNKADLTRRRPYDEIEAMVCIDWECGYVECSAKKNNNLEAVLREMGNQVTPSVNVINGPSSAKIHSAALLRRLFSRETRTSSLELDQKHGNNNESCKIS